MVATLIDKRGGQDYASSSWLRTKGIMSRISLDNLSILLVAPSRVLSRVLQHELQMMGAQNVRSCFSMEGAWQALQERSTDLVISSMYFEDGDGIGLITRIRENDQLANTMFMLVSAEQRVEMLEPIRQAGVMAILPRPFSREALERALNTCLAMKDGGQRNLAIEHFQHKRVLLVDDSRLARHHMMNVLVNVGFYQQNILTAEDGQQAIDLLEQGVVMDLVVTDYRMPHVDGEGLLHYIRQHERYKDIPVIMVTSENNDTRLGSIKSHGVTALMDKPFDVVHLKGLLDSHLSKH